MIEEQIKEYVLELAEGLYPIDEETQVIKMDHPGASVEVGDKIKALKMEDLIGEFKAEYIAETNTIYIIRSTGRWESEPGSGYQRWSR